MQDRGSQRPSADVSAGQGGGVRIHTQKADAAPRAAETAGLSGAGAGNERRAGDAPDLTLNTRGAFVRLHLSIVLAGFTGVLGKIITLSEGMLVWYRFGLTLLILGVIFAWRGNWPRLPWREARRLMGAGVLLCLHWLFFYGSIKASNVSIGVVCFALVGFFTALVEPWWTHSRVSAREVCLGLCTALGIGLIFSFDTRYRLGITLGVISSLLAALFTVRNKIVSAGHNAYTSLAYQMVGGFLLCCCILPVYIEIFFITYIFPTVQDCIGMLCLSLFCTVGMMTLIIDSLRVISAFTVNLSYNLEPVYSIIIAMLFLGEREDMGPSFFAGLTVIAASVLLQSFIAWKEQTRLANNLTS